MLLGSAHHHARTELERLGCTEPGHPGPAEYHHPLLGVGVGVGIRDLIGGESLDRQVVVLSRRDGNTAKPGRTELHEILGCGPEDAEIVEDLGQIADRVMAHGRHPRQGKQLPQLDRGDGETPAGSLPQA